MIVYLVVMECYSKVSKQSTGLFKEKSKKIALMDNKEQKIGVN